MVESLIHAGLMLLGGCWTLVVLHICLGFTLRKKY